MSTPVATEELFDLLALQRLFEYHWINERLCFDLVDAATGELILAVGLHPACARYHAADRLAPLSCKEAAEADADGMIRCSLGLTTAAVPIVVGDVRVATLYVGPMVTDPAPEEEVAETVRLSGMEASFMDDFKRIERTDRERFAIRVGTLTDMVTRMANRRHKAA